MVNEKLMLVLGLNENQYKLNTSITRKNVVKEFVNVVLFIIYYYYYYYYYYIKESLKLHIPFI